MQDNHVGSALFAGFIAGGHLTIGIVFAGLIVRCSFFGHYPNAGTCCYPLHGTNALSASATGWGCPRWRHHFAGLSCAASI